MFIGQKRHNSIRFVVGLMALVGATGWLAIGQTETPQNAAQQTQRPRRVGENNQTPETKKPPSAGAEEVDEGDVVRVDTQLVSVPAGVTDSSGRPLSGLRPENFQLIEDRRPQTVTNYSTAEPSFDITFMLDTSWSTR